MIILIYGQPASGKTTLANELIDLYGRSINIDGDAWRDVTKNKDYSDAGRKLNLKGAFDAALYLETQGFTVILSFVTPFKEMRTYLAENAMEYRQIYLTYSEDRGRNLNFAKSFEEPLDEKQLYIDTSVNSLEDTVKLTKRYINDKRMNNF
jgi:adenylate kinase family enzyme